MSLFEGLSVVERKECFDSNAEIDSSRGSFFCDWKNQEPFCSNADLWFQKLKSEGVANEEFEKLIAFKISDVNLLNNSWITIYREIMDYKECVCISDELYLKNPELICLNFTSRFIFFAKNQFRKNIMNSHLSQFYCSGISTII